MKTIGIVSEYNPFHNGHKYHIQASKEACGADSVICIMSGSFVQRGEPAMLDKWSRAEMALHGGADLVLELPFIYACQPAEIFAYGAVKILDSLNSIEYLCFGSELGDTQQLQKMAGLLADEPEYMSMKLKQYLTQGMTYPKAAASALSDTLKQHDGLDIPANITDTPNNVLGIEYIKSLILLRSSIKPLAIKRIVSGYNEAEITQPIASATAVRNEFSLSGMSDRLRQAVPLETYEIMNKLICSGKSFVSLGNFSDILLYKLRTASLEELAQIANIKEGIEYRIKKSADLSSDSEELINNIKTKRYTRTFIQRLLCHILLDVRQPDIEAAKRHANPVYVRVLGFNDHGKKILKKLKTHCGCPIITKAANFSTDNDFLKRMFELDTKATDIYSLGYSGPTGRQAKMDFLRSPAYVKSE